MLYRATAAFALFSSMTAAPAFAEARFGDLVAAIRLTGSEAMMVHALSYEGLPIDARIAREALLTNMGLRGTPGSVSGTNFRFAPIMSHDSNINGGYASDSFTVSGIPFTIGEDYKAVDGLVLGVSGTGSARFALGGETALKLRAGGSMGYAPEHDMWKSSLGGSACLDHMVDYSTHVSGCIDASYRKYDLGESKRVGASLGVKRVFSFGSGIHEVSAGVSTHRHLNDIEYTQSIANVSVVSAFPGPYAISAGLQLGEAVDGIMTMRHRVYFGVGFLAFERPTSVNVSFQKNEGSRWLGEDRIDTVTTFGLSHQFNNKVSVTGSVAFTDSTASFFDDTQYGLNVSWRF